MTEQGRRAFSFDCDGVLVTTFPYQAGALRRLNPSLFQPPTEIPDIYHGEIDGRLRKREIPSFLLHCLKRVPKSTTEAFYALDSQGLYVNTGRRNTKPWVDLTKRCLAKAGILERFQDLYFRPHGVTTAASKLSGVAYLRQQYDQVVHFDDNPLDGVPIALFFLDVLVVIVRDYSTNRLLHGVDLTRVPNLRVTKEYGNLYEAVNLASKGWSL